MREQFHIDFLKVTEELVAKLYVDRLLELDGHWLRPTLDGLAVADRLAVAFDVGTAAK